MSLHPFACQSCGQVSILASTSELCPHCESERSLTITEEDPRYLVFYTMAERIGRIEGTRKIVPTKREVAILNHGDQLYFNNAIIRIVAKTNGREGADPYIWLERYFSPVAHFEKGEETSYLLNRLPPAIPGHVLNQFSRETAREVESFPVSQDPQTKELLILCGDAEHFENVQAALPNLKLTYWLAHFALIREGLRILYSTAEINCRSGFEYECPLHWTALNGTDSEDVRFCDQCKERVYLVRNREERRFHTRKGHCAALNPNIAEGRYGFRMASYEYD